LVASLDWWLAADLQDGFFRPRTTRRVQMIARMWHGVTEAGRAEDYLNYLNKTGVPDYRATEGNRGVYVLRRIEADEAHFALISLRESADAIRSFAGTDIEVARYYPEDEGYLLELEPTVTHYDLLVKP
jgi:heme-degrading monooxygenase HmoA